MKIHEYQGKELLRQFGVPVPRGYPAFTVQEAVEAAQKLGGSVWVVKAQIHAGGRGKGGGVKLARSIDDAEEAGRRDPRHAAEDAPDRPRRPEGAPPVHRGRRRHQEGILRVAGHRPRHAEGRLHRVQRRRHGHRGSGPRHAREDHHRLHRSADRPRRRAGDEDRRRPSACRKARIAQAVDAVPEALQVLHGHRRLAGRDQPAQLRQQGQR